MLTKIKDIKRVRRAIWNVVFYLFYFPTPVFAFKWRVLLLRVFGGEVHWSSFPYPTARVWAPWNLVMERNSCLGPGADIYSVSRVTLKRGALVSQRAYLCTASHDYTALDFPLIGAPITLNENSWVAAEAFIAPGVIVGESAVVLARAVVTKQVEARVVVAGNPAMVVKNIDEGGSNKT